MTVDDPHGSTTDSAAVVHTDTWTGYDHPSTAIVESVANATGRDVDRLPRLHDYVDGDAIDALLAGAEDSVSISFVYDGSRVHVDGSGLIEVSQRV